MLRNTGWDEGIVAAIVACWCCLLYDGYHYYPSRCCNKTPIALATIPSWSGVCTIFGR